MTHSIPGPLKFFILLSLLLLTACGGSDNSSPYVYQSPENLNDGWQVGNAVDQGVDVVRLETLMNKIREDEDGFRYLDGLLIAKEGQLLLSENLRTKLHFADDWAGNKDIDLHILNSATKSFTSTLVGIAIDQQLISDVNVPVHDFFTDTFPIANWDDNKADITLEDWLTMRHGYVWNEWNVSYFDESNINSQMNNSADPIQFLLDRPMAGPPGETLAYSTGVSYGLGRIVQLRSGLNVVDFMDLYLFQPLNIENYTWWEVDGQLHTGSALYLSIRDMAKLGQLFLEGGEWNGARIVSEAWVNEATIARAEVDANRQYGYQWWMQTFTANGREYSTYFANGLGRQYIYVFPELNVVVAFQAHAYDDSERSQLNITQILQDYILPAVL